MKAWERLTADFRSDLTFLNAPPTGSAPATADRPSLPLTWPEWRWSRTLHPHTATAQPRHGLAALGQARLLHQRIVGSLAQPDHDLLRRDADTARGIRKLPEQRVRAGLREPAQTLRQTSIQQVRHHRQREVEIHVEPDVTAQAVQMKERDLFAQPILDVIQGGQRPRGRHPLRQVPYPEASGRSHGQGPQAGIRPPFGSGPALYQGAEVHPAVALGEPHGRGPGVAEAAVQGQQAAEQGLPPQGVLRAAVGLPEPTVGTAFLRPVAGCPPLATVGTLP